MPASKQLGLLQVLLTAGVRSADPALRQWLEERVSATLAPQPRCKASVEMRCGGCGRSRRLVVSCGTDCSHCQTEASRRSRVAKRVCAAIPRVATRHLVVSMPSRLRECLASGELAVKEVQDGFERTLFEHIRRRVAAQLGISPHADMRCGAVSIVHGFRSDLSFYPHLHALALDGAVVGTGAQRQFVELSEPWTSRQLASLAADFDRRVAPLRRSEGPDHSGVAQLRTPPAKRDPSPTPKLLSEDPEVRRGQSAGVEIFASAPIAPNDHLARRRLLEYLGRTPVDEDIVPVEESDASQLARRIAATADPRGPGILRQHGLMLARTARRWGLRPEQLQIEETREPARESAGRTTRTREVSSTAAPKPRATHRRDVRCLACGGEMVVQRLEERS
jgi:hypothetical protein